MFSVREGLAVLCVPNQAIEIRALLKDGSIHSGYSNNFDELARQVEMLDNVEASAVYFTLNPVNPALIARRSRVSKIRKDDPLTSDGDIVNRQWLPIDLDPVRPAGVSSTDSEKDQAKKKAEDIVGFLTNLGWPAPVVGDSGNGYHLLYRIDLPNDDVARELVKGCLEALEARFSDSAVIVDIKNFNAGRIWKLYGTLVRKGENNPDRPYRRSQLISVPEPIEVVDRSLLESLAAQVSKTGNTPTRSLKKRNRGFDLAEWLSEYGQHLPCQIIMKDKPGHRYFYLLDPCPFSGGTHKDGAFLGQLDTGAVYAKCHHNSCGNDNRWVELRELAESGQSEGNDQKKKRDHAKEDGDQDLYRILPFFEKEGRLYLSAIEPDGTFCFVHEEDGVIKVDSTVTGTDGEVIRPTLLPVHHDTRETVMIVGVPRADLIRDAPLLSPDDLYTRLDKHINRYADMPDQERELAIYYSLYTWVYVKSPTSPYLRYLGDTGKGKSRLLDVVSDLCLYPIRASGSSTTSGIMRFHERWRGTLVIDEGDLKGGADDPLIKFLNVGFERGKYIILSDTNDPTRQLTFHPYGPKVLAMRQPFKDNATEGRCISYSPYETRRKDIPPELSSEYHREVAELRAIIARFVLARWPDVDGEKMMEFHEIDIEPRLVQMARPISIVLQLFPNGKARFIEYLKARQQEIKRMRSESWEGMLFNHAYTLAVGEESDDGHQTDAVTARAIAEVFKTSSKTVTQTLHSIGFESEVDNITNRRPDGTPVRKTIRKLVVGSPQKWQEITARYWFTEDDPEPPPCPEILRGRRWIDVQMKLPSLPAESVPYVTSETPPIVDEQSVTDISDVTHPEQGTNSDKPSPTTEHQTPCTEVLRESITECIAPPDSPPENRSESSGPFTALLRRYGLPSDTVLTRHVAAYQPDSKCGVSGCNSEPMWKDLSSTDQPLPLCTQHFESLRKALKEETEPCLSHVKSVATPSVPS